MPSYRSCSWCHTENDVGAQWCRACGHRADRPRLACDCGVCRRVMPVNFHRWTEDWAEGVKAAATEEIPF